MGIINMKKYVYSFGDGAAEGKVTMKDLLGGKGANLAEMCSLGLPVPPGLTITTEVCTDYYSNNKKFPEGLEKQVNEAIAKIEKTIGSKFGDNSNPLLVSVRSGARVSMPGMMDTILNLGLNDETVKGLSQKSGNPRFAWDSYRRFVQMYADVVLGVDHYIFEEIIDEVKADARVELDTELSVEKLQSLVEKFKEKVAEETGKPFPADVKEQLWGAIGAVFESWMSSRAITYRKINEISDSWGTAVNVQSMVFGNMGDTSATGVAFTRNPSTGENAYYGEYLINAQGEDVVAGIRTPQPLTKKERTESDSDLPSMEETMPDVYKQLASVFDKLEKHYRDMQDIEFTVQDSKLWMLQTRSGKRTAAAAIKIAVDMVAEKLITKEEAIKRLDPSALDQLLHPSLDPKAEKKILTKGLPASPGAASGEAVFTAEEAEDLFAKGKDVILVRVETSPEDISGMHVSKGVLTARGGMTSHAAVVARGMGKPCVSGAGALKIDYKTKTCVVGDVTIKQGDIITINGTNGEVMLGKVPTIQPNLSGDFAKIMEWADEIRTLKVRSNAETPLDATTARKFGAEGIGLCRTEHMFFDQDRIISMRQMILADTEEGRRAALAKLEPMQKEDFVQIFKIMGDFPVTIRLLDPPLHEFLPHSEEEMKEVAFAANVSIEKVRYRASMLKESNPMLGHRGCRLGVTYPEIYEMQARAIFDAAKETGAKPEIMIPLVMTKKELDLMKAVIEKARAEVAPNVEYLLGTMIELPRAALKAGEIAETAEFFSFGTNDLTQTTLGISRDDSSNFIDDYRAKGIVEQDPFAVLDVEGVGELIQIAVERGRATRKNIKLGICGEHGGNPQSIAFCQKVGLDYVSCSPYRVPIARLAAAQAALNSKEAKKKAA